jgi:hypothetical protein
MRRRQAGPACSRHCMAGFRRAVADRRRGGRDWYLSSAPLVAQGAREYRTRPVAAADQLGQRDSANTAGGVAEGLAAWLSQVVPGGAADRDLAGLAVAFRRVASWAQAGELAMVAQVAARSAARDEKIGLAEGGRPAWVSRDAAALVSLGLALSPCGGEAWAQLAVTLQWRLPATGAVLAAGDVDLYRAKMIAADPQGAEQRREATARPAAARPGSARTM